MIRNRVVFEGDGNGEPPRPDYVYRDEAVTVGETMLYGSGHWRIVDIKKVPDEDIPVVVLRRVRRSS